MTKAKPLRKNWTEDEALPDMSGDACFDRMKDAEIDALFEDNEFQQWLGEKIDEAERNPGPAISSDEMRKRIDDWTAAAMKSLG